MYKLKYIGRQMERCMDGKMEIEQADKIRNVNRKIDRWMYQWTNVCMDRYMYKWRNAYMGRYRHRTDSQTER